MTELATFGELGISKRIDRFTIAAMNAVLVIAGVERPIASHLSHRDVRVYLNSLGHGPGTLWHRSARISFDTEEKIVPGGRYLFIPLRKSATMRAILVFDGITKEEIISTPRSLIQFLETRIDLSNKNSSKEGSHRKGKDAKHKAEIMAAVSEGRASFLGGAAEDQEFAKNLTERVLHLPRGLRYQAIGLFGSALKTTAARQNARTQLENFENEAKMARSELNAREWEAVYRAACKQQQRLSSSNTCSL